ncbi:alpha/beta fold hydrolase [Agrobacterium larrymoorei]|uniref:Pimeloyl-ACP methyl ester carboxylesterase n=1 Tax=Agrobacterium larrymoorei TaxID=160699 RepID=A0ABU0UE55_9HYPH|nr:alpha/beta hydrolase [Agrobacterium larrymoorei]MDQ1183214.1 pimeloyl-ACP methyl ester carboxylesterase [Agrobacterium larrymoorei]
MELLLLHALPLDGTMWAKQMDLLPGATHAPTLYDFGDNIESWAEKALSLTTAKRLVVVGCSVGGSCALEVAALAPDRVSALVLIGSKAWRRRDLVYHSSALQILEEEGLELAWWKSWSPLLSKKASPEAIEATKEIALRQSPEKVARGVRVFHTRPSREDVLTSFSGPVAIVTGSGDIAPGVEISRKQADMARRGRSHVIPDCGHYVPIEKPEVLNCIIRRVLETA